MNPRLLAVRAGLSRGGIELRQTLTSPTDLITFVLMTGGFLAAMLSARHTLLPGTAVSLGTSRLVSVLALDVGMYAVLWMADRLVGDREDGTLLRAKAIPHGMLGYLVGKVVSISAQVLIAVAATLLAGAFLVAGLAIGSPGGWLTLAWVLVLGLLATLPLGAVLGSLFPNTRTTALIFLVLGGLAAISGIFYPITRLPVFLQWTGQVFPLYWLGLGMRSALLPHAMAVVEVGHSWRQPATVAVLLAWAIAGLVLAPVVLRRMARRESGSRVAARREKAMRG
ncbi:ABC transporter permease [Actinocrinis puniceicyclus]|uniref:ABC transporter permease n=1 Tax=Actinocrinis puniceicyclus TaxID=977794 RepID=A0A8J8BHB6_9ACTN|nr:ABC transporter permease [Actinocrinis puniceicyclus]MBS2966624.1 ABC transporter permease [Actinocrinis puniceicyclus]